MVGVLAAALRVLSVSVSLAVLVLAISAALPVTNDCCAASPEEPAWRTAFLRRGFMGELNAPPDVIRSPTPIAMQGTKARVYIAAQDHVVAGERISLVKGKDRAGNIELPVYEFAFSGRTTFDVPARQDKPPRVSDDLEIPLAPGLWYLQESAGEKAKIPYFFDLDGGFRAKTSDAPGVHRHDWRGGLVYRIDVLTTDRRPGVVCMGDSITQGAGSTPNAGCRYPDVLERLINRPVLNTGVNGDQLVEFHRQIGFLDDPVPLAGVADAVFVMGTNDIIGGGRIKSIEDFKKVSTDCLNYLRHENLRVVWGTILPATGFKGFDKNPGNELLRRQANQFIREGLHPDAVADFDAVMSDPDNPDRMRKDFQCGDWVHPNDAGYKAMATEAARQLRAEKRDGAGRE